MKHILLMPNTEKDGDYSVTLNAAAVLHRAGATLYAEETHEKILGKYGIIAYSAAHIPEEIEGILVFGGDGSILNAATTALSKNIPLLGINMGHLGYLADLEIPHISEIARLVNDDYETRMVHVLRFAIDGKMTDAYAVNEITVSRGELPYIAEMELVADSGSVSYRADGLIIATPTGSTAYSLSAGGPVIDASLDLVTVTPICPHSFFARSIVFPVNAALTVYNRNARLGALSVAVDGRRTFSLPANASLTVEKAEKALMVLSLKKRRFLDVLKEKMSL